jgi:hypothetical protein
MGILVQIGASDSRSGGVAAGPVGVQGAVFLLAARGRAPGPGTLGAFHPNRPDGR